MNINLATYIDRAKFLTTTTAKPKEWRMPNEKEINIKETDADSQQNGLINNSISGNSVEKNIDFIQLHFQSTMAVVGLVVLIIGLCCMWRMCKMKNIRKIAKFVCLQKCKVTEEMLEVEEKSQGTRRNIGNDFGILDVEALVSMANKATIENAYLRNQQVRPTAEDGDLSAC